MVVAAVLLSAACECPPIERSPEQVMGQPPRPDVVAMLIDQMVDELLLILEAIAAKVTKELALDPCQADAIDHAPL